VALIRNARQKPLKSGV